MISDKMIRPFPPKRLFSPFPARTHTTIDILWDKPLDYSSLVTYECVFDVYVDNKCAGTTTKGNFKITGLKPDTSYQIFVKTRHNNDGTQSEQTETITVATKPAGKEYDVLDFGATGDGQALTTAALQAAIDACCENGTVVVPRGNYKTGALFLKSDMTLYLAQGAKLIGSHNPEDYPSIRTRIEGREIDNVFASIITAGQLNLPLRLKNITICGEGTIDAQGSILAPRQTAARNRIARSNVITIMDCDGVYLQGITIEDAPFWTIHPINCDNVVTEGVVLHTETNPHSGERYNVDNCDGWDPDSCINCYAYNIEFNTHDDCVAIKSGTHHEGINQRRPSRNIRITDCHFRAGGGLALGSEMPGGIEDVFVQDCVLGKIDRGIQIKTRRGRGAYIRNVVMKDIVIDDGGEYAIKLNMRYYDDNLELPMRSADDPSTPFFENMHFENIVCKKSRAAIQLQGLPESLIRNCTFKNVEIVSTIGVSGDYCDRVHFDNVKVDILQGNMSFFKNCKNVTGDILGSAPSAYKSELISDLVVYDNDNAENWSIQNKFMKDVSLYSDKSMNLVNEIPDELAGAEWVRTAHDSRLTSGDLASFVTNLDVSIYVAHADAISDKPSWLLSGWEKTELVLKEHILEWERNNSFTFYKKQFSAGSKVMLGQNGGSVSDQMYTIVMKKNNYKTLEKNNAQHL